MQHQHVVCAEWGRDEAYARSVCLTSWAGHLAIFKMDVKMEQRVCNFFLLLLRISNKLQQKLWQRLNKCLVSSILVGHLVWHPPVKAGQAFADDNYHSWPAQLLTMSQRSSSLLVRISGWQFENFVKGLVQGHNWWWELGNIAPTVPTERLLR